MTGYLRYRADFGVEGCFCGGALRGESGKRCDSGGTGAGKSPNKPKNIENENFTPDVQASRSDLSSACVNAEEKLELERSGGIAIDIRARW